MIMSITTPLCFLPIYSSRIFNNRSLAVITKLFKITIFHNYSRSFLYYLRSIGPFTITHCLIVFFCSTVHTLDLPRYLCTNYKIAVFHVMDVNYSNMVKEYWSLKQAIFKEEGKLEALQKIILLFHNSTWKESD